MKPILLQGHTRALTTIKYNLEGDLLFSVSKDKTPCVWFSHNGERLGTYNGHGGTVWTVDPKYDSSLLITGSADNSAKLWDTQRGSSQPFLSLPLSALTLLPNHMLSFRYNVGVCLTSFETESAVRTSGWSYSGTRFFFSTDAARGQISELRIFELAAAQQEGEWLPYNFTPPPEMNSSSLPPHP